MRPVGQGHSKATALTSTGFLLKMKKFSALIIMKRMNLWHRIFSISSACKSKSQHHSHCSRSEVSVNDLPTCLTAMLTLTELMEPSIKTFSLSLRLIITGCRSSSLLLLRNKKVKTYNWSIYNMHCSVWTLMFQWLTLLLPLACCVAPQLGRRNSPGRGRPARSHAPHWDMGVRWQSEGGQERRYNNRTAEWTSNWLVIFLLVN